MHYKRVKRSLAWMLSAAMVLSVTPSAYAEEILIMEDEPSGTEENVTEEQADGDNQDGLDILGVEEVPQEDAAALGLTDGIAEESDQAAAKLYASADGTVHITAKSSEALPDGTAWKTEADEAQQEAVQTLIGDGKFEMAKYTVLTADGSEVTFPEDTVFTVETQMPEGWKEIAGVYAYDGALKEVNHSGAVFEADTLDDWYVLVGEDENASETAGESETAAGETEAADETELAEEENETTEEETEVAGESETATEETEVAGETETVTEETEVAGETEPATEETEVTEETETTAEETEPATETEVQTEIFETETEVQSEDFETELAETESETEAIEVETASEDEIMPLADDGWMTYTWTNPDQEHFSMAFLEVISFNEEIAPKLTEDCTFTVEQITEGASYDAVKEQLNAKHDNSVSKFGYLKLILKDKDGNEINLEDSNTLIKFTYIGALEGVTNVPSYVYGTFASTLMDGGFLDDTDHSAPSYTEGMGVGFSAMLIGTNEVAVVAQDDLIKACPLNPGVYTITANLTVLGENNTVLPFPVQVYLGNPNFPPVTPLSYNAKLVVDEDKNMIVTIENFSQIFQIASMESGETIHILDYEEVDSKSDSIKDVLGDRELYFRHEKRINKLVLKLDNANGLYQFGDCVQSPIILDEDTNMIMHLQVNFDEVEYGFDDSKGTVTSKEFTDDATGITVSVQTTEDAYAQKLEGAQLEVKANKNDRYAQMVRETYYDGTAKYQIYDIALKDKDGNEIDLSNTENTETKLTIPTTYSENRLWKLNGLDMTKMRANSAANSISYTNMKTGLGTFAVVDNTSATQYATAKVKSGDAVAIYSMRQSDGLISVTEDSDIGSYAVNVYASQKDLGYGTAYFVAADQKSDGGPVRDFGKGEQKLSLYVPYDASKNYYYVTSDGMASTVKKLDVTDHCGDYVMLDVVPETIQANETGGYIRSIGLKNGYNASGEDPEKFSSYILVTDKAVASTPMAPKTPNGADNTVNNKEIVYSGTEQSCFEGGEHYEITAGGFTGINAGTVSVTVRPESGYIWSDGTAGEKTIQNEIKKHNLCVRYKSEIVLVNGTPKYEVEYGYSTPVISFTSERDNFVNGETPDTASGFVAPTIAEHTTDVAGDYVLTPTGGAADNYEIVLVSGTLHVLDSEEKIVAIPKTYDDTTYPHTSSSSHTYIVPKDATEVKEVIGFLAPDENAHYTLTGDLSSNKLGRHSIQANVEAGYVWEDGTTNTKYFSYSIYQIADKPEAVESVEYTGNEVSLFDAETLEELKAKGGRWSFVAYLSTTPLVMNDQYVETEIGDYKVLVTPNSGYCWDETGSKKTIEYNWSIVAPHSDKEIAATETITANLSLKGSDASAAGLTILEGLVGADGHAYLTNPNAPTADSNEDNDPNWVQTPPTTAVEDNATLTIYKDGTMSVTVPVKNAVFTLQKLGNCEALSEGDVKITKRNGNYGEKMSRIDSITIPVTEKEGTFVFNGCEVYPTLLRAGYTVPLTLTIGGKIEAEPVSIADAAVSGIKNAVYTGKAITQSGLKVVVGGVVTLTEGTDYTVAYKNNVNAGKATLTITGIGNYKDSITKTFTIGRKAVAKKPVARTGLVYNGKAQTGVASVANVTFTGARARTNAGTYTVKASVGSNYKWPDGTTAPLTLIWSIKKAAQKVTTKVSTKTYSYTTLSKKAYSFAAGASASGKGKLTYKVIKTPAKAASYITVSAAGVVTMRKGAPAGTYQIRVSAAANTNYNAASKVVTVNVKKGTQSITAKVTTKTYTTSALKKAAASYTIGASASGKGKLTYKVTSTPAKAAKYISVTSAGKVTMKKNAPKGTYVITITAAETANYLKGTKTVKVVVK